MTKQIELMCSAELKELAKLLDADLSDEERKHPPMYVIGIKAAAKFAEAIDIARLGAMNAMYDGVRTKADAFRKAYQAAISALETCELDLEAPEANDIALIAATEVISDG